MPRKILEHIADFKTVVWDWNGTLLDDLAVVMKTEAEHFPHYGIQPPTLEERNRLFCFPIRTYYERVGFDFSALNFDEVSKHFMGIFERLLLEAPLFNGTEAMLAEIGRSGKAQFVLSAAHQEHLDEVLPSRGIAHHFRAAYGLPHKNADTKIGRGRDLIRDFGIDPSTTLMIGDTDHDLEVAHALGFEALLVADGHKPYEVLSALHHRVLESRYSE